MTLHQQAIAEVAGPLNKLDEAAVDSAVRT